MLVSDVRPQMHLINLIIQPSVLEVSLYLGKIGFQKLSALPQLLYFSVTDTQLASIFLKLSQVLSEAEQESSRFVLTELPPDSPNVLIEFLKAQPLSSITQAVKYAWFFQILVKRTLLFKYQPIFSFSSGEVVAHECLARAIHEEEYFSGYQLIEAAISTQLACEFDELARTTCLRSIAATNSRQTFFVNLLPNAILRAPNFLEQNLEQLLELGLKPQQIVFELTEVEALKQHSEMAQIINRVQEWGFGIAIDDLCGGVSIDHYFMEFRPDILKVDRRIVHGCSQHVLKQIILKSILDSAHELNILVVAEGLENLKDIEFCRQLGVDYGQGFALGMPELALRQQPLDFVGLSAFVAS